MRSHKSGSFVRANDFATVFDPLQHRLEVLLLRPHLHHTAHSAHVALLQMRATMHARLVVVVFVVVSRRAHLSPHVDLRQSRQRECLDTLRRT